MCSGVMDVIRRLAQRQLNRVTGLGTDLKSVTGLSNSSACLQPRYCNQFVLPCGTVVL
jgi:hypothetical protein